MYILQNLKMLWNYMLRSGSLYNPEVERDEPEQKKSAEPDDSSYLFDNKPDYSSEIPPVTLEDLHAVEERVDLINTALTGFRSQWKEHDNQNDTRLSVLETRVSETERKNNDYTEFNNRLSVLTTRIDELDRFIHKIQDDTPAADSSQTELLRRADEDAKTVESTAPVLDIEGINKKFKAYGDIYARLTAELKTEREMRLEQESKIETIIAVNRKLAEKIAAIEGVEIPAAKAEETEKTE